MKSGFFKNSNYLIYKPYNYKMQGLQSRANSFEQKSRNILKRK